MFQAAKQGLHGANGVPLSLRLVIGFGFMGSRLGQAQSGAVRFSRSCSPQIGAPSTPKRRPWVSTFVELLGGPGDLRGGVRRGRECSAHRHDARGDVHRAPEVWI